GVFQLAQGVRGLGELGILQHALDHVLGPPGGRLAVLVDQAADDGLDVARHGVAIPADTMAPRRGTRQRAAVGVPLGKPRKPPQHRPPVTAGACNLGVYRASSSRRTPMPTTRVTSMLPVRRAARAAAAAAGIRGLVSGERSRAPPAARTPGTTSAGSTAAGSRLRARRASGGRDSRPSSAMKEYLSSSEAAAMTAIAAQPSVPPVSLTRPPASPPPGRRRCPPAPPPACPG